MPDDHSDMTHTATDTAGPSPYIRGKAAQTLRVKMSLPDPSDESVYHLLIELAKAVTDTAEALKRMEATIARLCEAVRVHVTEDTEEDMETDEDLDRRMDRLKGITVKSDECKKTE